MGEKSGSNMVLERMPLLKKWYILLLLLILQIILFLGSLVIFRLISFQFFFGAILSQLIVSTLLSIHYILIANNAEKIRLNYKKKYAKLAWQYFWFIYQPYLTPVISAVFYFPLLLYTGYDFLPELFPQPDHFLTNSLLPFYIALILGLFIVVIGFLIKRKSGDYDKDYDDYFHVIYPEKSKLLTKEIFSYIRNPQYLGRGLISIGFGIIANNISAIVVGFIHLVSYCAIIPAEDKELQRRFGNDFVNYKKKVPALLPKYGNWINFAKFIFRKR